MTRYPHDCIQIVAPYTFRVGQYAAVSHEDALALLGEDAHARLMGDPIRKLGPRPGTVYPWNVEAYLMQPNLRKTNLQASTRQ